MNKVNLCWVVSEGRKGHEIQSLTVANALAHQVKLFRFKSTWIQRLTAPQAFAHRLQQTPWQTDEPDFSSAPDLIISCGRQAAAAAKNLNHKTDSKHIHILNPKGNLTDYDLLLLPRHDEFDAPNVCHFTGSIHDVNRLIYSTQKGLCNSCIAVMIGNPDKTYWQQQWPADWAQIRKLNKKVIICGSPRLSEQAKSLLHSSTQGQNVSLWLSNEDGQNPYENILVSATQFFVTADSINMMNECLATGKNVNFLGTKFIKSRRHINFIQTAEYYLSSLKDEEIQQQLWPNPLNEIIGCTKVQNLLKSPPSFKTG